MPDVIKLATRTSPDPLPAASPRRVRSHVVMGLLSLLLLAAAALKSHELATSPLLKAGPITSRPLLVALIEVEIVLAAWMLSGAYARWCRRAAITCFAAFACAAASEAWLGAKSCGCFGRVSVDPRLTLALDLAGILSLVFLVRPEPGPNRHRDGLRLGIGGLFFLLAGGSAAIAATKFRPYEVPASEAEPMAAAPGSLVVLSPGEWVGKPFRLYTHIDVGAKLRSGKWKVVLFHHDCSACEQAMPGFETLAEDARSQQAAPKVMLVEMPPYASAGRKLTHPGRAYEQARLSTEYDWFAQTPLVVDLDGGIVTAAASQEH